MRVLGLLAATALTVLNAVPVRADQAARIPLRDGWTIRPSAEVSAAGATVSQPGFDVSRWHKVTVPNTVVGALVQNGQYPDPYFGMNLRGIPGTTYPIGERFTLLPTPADSPFKSSWWYRTEFTLPPNRATRALWINFNGINYRANIWINGVRIAAANEVVGAFRRYRFEITRHVRATGPNALAVEVTGPEPHDLAIMWVDWNPTPADKNMGLWGDVFLTDSGPIAIEHPFVSPTLEVPSLRRASLTVTTEVRNTTDEAVTGTVRGSIGSITFDESVSLAAREHRTLIFTPDRVKA
ncbi:MAG TPA: beta galactosidase jelly roll domain-containing protein, partial [Vicinamibacterales bacterium]|nr:beta galactosidase jelly roll domain-containing protein [Vicinamibacterales bacterium]